MSIPEVKVEIEVDPSAGTQPFFTLDDADTGVLDGDFGLGGLSFADVSLYVQSVSVERGKTNQLEGYDAGNASVTFINVERIFDPLGASPFKDQLLPRRGINIYSGGTPLFVGIVEDWALDYDKSGDNKAIAIATDRFLLLANQELESFTNSVQKSGDRIETILNRPEVAWPSGDRNIETGQVELQGETIDDNTNVLNYLQKVAESEGGSLFISKDGKLTFFDNIKGPSSVDLLKFSDDDTETPFQEVSVIIGGEFLYNRVIIEAFNGVPQLAEDVESQNFFGISTLSQDNLLMNFDIDALIKANRLLAKYKNPGYRFDTLTTDLNAVSNTDIDAILSKDLTDVIQVEFTPNKIGSPIVKLGQIIGIRHDIDLIGSHRVTFNLDTLDFAPFVLDDAVFGVLDDYGLG
jgi:hypothetical protein